MVYLGENGSRDPTPAARWFDIHPDLIPNLASEVATMFSLFEASRNSWDTTEGPGGSMVDPPTEILIHNDNGKRHDHHLVYSRLTCGFQIR